MIELEGIDKSYRLGKVTVEALVGINLRIEAGEFLSITGPSGSGKSTLMNIIGCLDRPSRGNYLLDGIAVSQMNDDRLAEIRNRKVGFVFQNFNLLPRLTAMENVALPLFYAGVSRSERLRRAEEALSWVELSDRLQHRPSELSGGECQRVAIARALVNRPSLILADEPTGNLDQKAGREIMNLFTRLNREQRVTLVLVTHDPQVAALAPRQVGLIDGRLVRDEEREN